MGLKKILFVLFAVSLAALMSCDGHFPFPPENKAQIMMTQASPDAPAVDVYVDDLIVARDFEYPNSTRYVTLDPVEHKITLRVAGEEQIVLESTIILDADTHYSYFACDSLSKISDLLLVDDFSSPEIDRARLRFVNLSPNAPALDLTDADGAVLFANIPFRGATDFIGIDAGLVDLQLRRAGTDEIVLELNNLTLAPYAAFTIWAKGFIGGDGEQEFGAELLFHKFLQ